MRRKLSLTLPITLPRYSSRCPFSSSSTCLPSRPPGLSLSDSYLSRFTGVLLGSLVHRVFFQGGILILQVEQLCLLPINATLLFLYGCFQGGHLGIDLGHDRSRRRRDDRFSNQFGVPALQLLQALLLSLDLSLLFDDSLVQGGYGVHQVGFGRKGSFRQGFNMGFGFRELNAKSLVLFFFFWQLLIFFGNGPFLSLDGGLSSHQLISESVG
jgi:hypothetical protein